MMGDPCRRDWPRLATRRLERGTQIRLSQVSTPTDQCTRRRKSPPKQRTLGWDTRQLLRAQKRIISDTPVPQLTRAAERLVSLLVGPGTSAPTILVPRCPRKPIEVSSAAD